MELMEGIQLHIETMVTAQVHSTEKMTSKKGIAFSDYTNNSVAALGDKH